MSTSRPANSWNDDAVQFVGIVRDFLLGSRALIRVSREFRAGNLAFGDVEALVGDSTDSVLFRLKERCHALFRGAGVGLAPEAVFDLAVGALFHEAMKFRENFYQHAVYAPKLLALESQGDPAASRLIDASRELLAASKDRSAEVLHELERWHRETTHQFEVLVSTHRDNAYVTRFVLEHRDLAEEALGAPLDVLLSRFWGDPASAYTRAALSFLDGGHFEDALVCIEEARREGATAELDRWQAYATGMRAYLASSFDEAVHHLGLWCRDPAADASFAGLAAAVLVRAGAALADAGQSDLAAAAKKLTERARDLDHSGNSEAR